MKKFTELVLKRPVSTFLAIISLIFFGLIAVKSSKLELMPEMEMPMMILTTSYPGASPEDIDELVTKPIEDGVSVLSNVKEVKSHSSENISVVIIRYNYGTNMDEAYNEIRKKVDNIKATLPEDASDPSFVSMDLNQQPSMYLAINNPYKDDIYNYVQNDIKPELEKLSSIASIDMSGGKAKYITVETDPEKLTQYGLSIKNVADTIKASDFTYPAGTVLYGSQELSINTNLKYDTINSIKNIPIFTSSGNTVYVSDIGDVYKKDEKEKNIGRCNAEDTIILKLTKTQESSAVELSKQAKEEIEKLKEGDENLSILLIYDEADMIKNSLKSVFETMIMAIIISMFIIFIFFGDLKASLIVGTSIPLSILMTLILLSAKGYSINVITISAVVLGVGMMVDNSIVILEACFRSMDELRENTKNGRKKAALLAVKTVGASVMASTATTCVVFLPLAFMKGLSGQFFAPLGYTVSFCMIASLISAVSIVPLCYVMYKPEERKNAPAYKFIRKSQDIYRDIIEIMLSHRKVVMTFSILLFIGSIFLATGIKKELMPQSDEGSIQIEVETRPGLNLKDSKEIIRKIEDILKADSDVENFIAKSGITNGRRAKEGMTLVAFLKDDRVKSTKETEDLWRKQLQNMEDTVINVEEYNTLSSMKTDKREYQIILRSTDYKNLKKCSDNIVNDLRERDDLTSVHSSLENFKPLIKLNVDVLKAEAAGIMPISIGKQLHDTNGGIKAREINVNGEELPIMVEYKEGEYDSLEKIKHLMLDTTKGTKVELMDLADIEFADSPSDIDRNEREYELSISAEYSENADIDSEKNITEFIEKNYINGNIRKASDRSSQMMREEFGALGLAILIAVFLVFVLMASQFESISFSLMVMTTIPFSLIGAFFLLWIVGSSISMPSILGFLMLSGTVVNNGILYVDTVNQLREKMDMRSALIEAGAIRLRPILMTTLTTVLAMIPMAIAYGKNGKLMQGLALADVGGITASTIMALLVLPVYYSLVYGRKSKKTEKNDED